MCIYIRSYSIINSSKETEAQRNELPKVTEQDYRCRGKAIVRTKTTYCLSLLLHLGEFSTCFLLTEPGSDYMKKASRKSQKTLFIYLVLFLFLSRIIEQHYSTGPRKWPQSPALSFPSLTLPEFAFHPGVADLFHPLL
jgi:hypothetical protein